MVAAALTETDIGIIAVVVVVLAVLVYLLLRRDPGVRLSRFGVFVERERVDDEPDVDAGAVDDDEAPTATWPKG